MYDEEVKIAELKESVEETLKTLDDILLLLDELHPEAAGAEASEGCKIIDLRHWRKIRDL